MWAFQMSRRSTPASCALEVVVVLAAGFLAALALGLGLGRAAASATALASVDAVLAFARLRQQSPDEGASTHDAT